MTDNIILDPIGVVSSPVKIQTDSGWSTVVSTIELDPDFRPGLMGLEQFSHLVVVTYLHEAKFDSGRHLRRRPRGMAAMPEIGIFSQRAKDRPNPIGITAVEIVEVTDKAVTVRGLDAIDGTPILDIKPYYPHFDRVVQASVPQWVDELMKGY